MKTRIPTICFIAPGSGYGKTELIEGVIIRLSKKLKIFALKHSGHNFEPDKEKDTWRFRKAGAMASAIITEGGLAALFVPDTSLEGAIKLLDRLNPDLILCEGFKSSTFPKILILREEQEFGLIPYFDNILAVVFERHAPNWVKIPVLKKNPEIVSKFVLNYYRQAKGGI
jgi:molybdopterin-guanine dinucleotide biosynthesis protein B